MLIVRMNIGVRYLLGMLENETRGFSKDRGGKGCQRQCHVSPSWRQREPSCAQMPTFSSCSVSGDMLFSGSIAFVPSK